MRTTTKHFVGAAFVIALATPLPGFAQTAGEELAKAAFMVGCWAEPAPAGSGLREIFTPPSENLLIGISQFWREGRIAEFEFHVIESSTRGPVLTPHPGGVASVSFQPAEVGRGRIVWQNLEHDFPQRIIYERVASDTLVARVEGGEGAAARATEWRMARVPCV